MPGNAPVPGFVELGTIILALPFWKKCMPTGNVIAIQGDDWLAFLTVLVN